MDLMEILIFFSEFNQTLVAQKNTFFLPFINNRTNRQTNKEVSLQNSIFLDYCRNSVIINRPLNRLSLPFPPRLNFSFLYIGANPRLLELTDGPIFHISNNPRSFLNDFQRRRRVWG